MWTILISYEADVIMERRGEGGVGEHYLHGAICNFGVQHLGLTPPAMRAKRAWISISSSHRARSNRRIRRLSRGSASNGYPTLPESWACETFGTFVGI